MPESNIQLRIDNYRTQDDRLREKPRHSEDRLYGPDLDWFRLNVVGYRRTLPPPSSGECWIWRGTLSSTGKPVMRVAGKRMGAHRAAYATWIRPIKPDDVIRQACGDYRCVNPCHLASRKYGWPEEFGDYRRASVEKRRDNAEV